jgi:hypothetical protein
VDPLVERLTKKNDSKGKERIDDIPAVRRSGFCYLMQRQLLPVTFLPMGRPHQAALGGSLGKE